MRSLFLAGLGLLFLNLYFCVNSSAQEPTREVERRVTEIEQQLNADPRVHEISAGILQPLYDLSVFMSRPWFYWVAFMLMSAGVVSFALQLVLTKLILLFRLRLSISEVLSDSLGLLISLAGLVMVTQAAAQNSSFTENAAAVVTAAGAGLLIGVVFYFFGQRTEFDAARDRTVLVQQEGVDPRVR
jgi:hypothetical protein